jgi:hypothetical protein
MQVRRSIAFLRACTPALLLVTAAAAQPAPPAPPPYVVLGAQGPVARAIMIPDASNNNVPPCPRIEVDGTPRAMTIRAEPDGKDFNIRVCEFALGAATRASIAGQTLRLPPDKLETIAVLGDTGCRIKVKEASAEQAAQDADEEEDEDQVEAAAAGNKKPKVQDCKDPEAWPFQTVSTTIAEAKPDLVIHVGDYLYRESACPPDYQKDCGGSPHGDNWPTWAADFFTPGADLLKAAPWIVTRGNHEDCERAWRGYALMLDPTPLGGGDTLKCVPMIDQYTVTAGGRAFIMLDSSDAADECPDSGCESEPYKQQFKAMTPAPGTWLVTHKPIWGFTNSKNKKTGERELGIRNMTLQDALDNDTFNNKPPDGIVLVLSGHIHLWEAIGFKDERSPQFVLGDGGTKLAHKITEELVGQKIGGTRVAAAATEHRFGYTLFEPSKNGGHWNATLYNTNGKEKVACKVWPSEIDCK